MKIQVSGADCVLTLDHSGDGPLPLQALMDDLEKETIRQLLEDTKGIKARVALKLKMNRTTLVEKAKRYGFPLRK